MKSDTLYYDGLCPICQREVATLARLKKPSLKLVDVHDVASLTPEQRQQLMNRLHVHTAEGVWLKGYQANLQAWRHTPMAKWVALLNLWPIRKLGEGGMNFG